MASQTLPNQMPDIPAQNFTLLRDEAQADIARLSGEGDHAWTDHNLHDPGITFMEAACFAMTDLGYRLDFPIADLIAQPNGEKAIQPFWYRDQVLSCQPVTENDYRRVILDIDGVHNVQLDLDIEANLWDIQVVSTPGTPVKTLADRVRRRFLEHRNLAEDLGSLKILEQIPVKLKLQIALEDGADTAEALSAVLAELADHIEPGVDFESYHELLAKGHSANDLTIGPWLDKGYLSEASLSAPALHDRLYISRLVTLALAQPGVQAVDQLRVTDIDWPDANHWESWIYTAQTRKSSVLDLENTLKYSRVTKEGIVVSLPVERIISLFNDRRKAAASPGRASTLAISGRYRSLNDYISLQYELPAMYGVGRDGTAPGESPERLAAVQQLQAYLLMFDQVLANQFSQLDHLRHLLGLPDSDQVRPLAQVMEKMQASLPLTDSEISRFWQMIMSLPDSHRSQPVTGLQQLPEILDNHWPDYGLETTPAFQLLTEEPFSDRQLDRHSRSLEHLLSRYHEQVPDRAMLKYEELFSHYTERLLTHPDASRQFTADQLTVKLAQLKSLLDRALFLLDIPNAGGHRGQSGNYLDPAIRSGNNISGFRHRVYRRLGLPRVAMGTLATHNGEGFHLVEGVLLRHSSNDILKLTPGNPLAGPHEIFVIVPDWPSRFADPDFAQLFVDTLYQELPVHLTPRLIWLNRAAMADFEQVHNSWLNALPHTPFDPDQAHLSIRRKTLNDLSGYLNRFLQETLASETGRMSPDISDWPVRQLTLGDYQSRGLPVESFVVGHQAPDTLNYDPDDQSQQVRIGQARVGSETDEQQTTDDQFIIRIRKPYEIGSD